ncbi:patatin-like protein [Xylophilus sp. GOD-11R]|uniref:patatin-like protein n=1 Tax=Xylophilus sp. GOD-11R TaxID=3089814 RepID=UPI00298CD738|nr:patatin-like protein [Xylophilus sp. GOD-11R]WPB55533.1 patatin-like protein [Xylophilus sp. GOD-11R]
MPANATHAARPPEPAPDYTAEIRFGIVMYGGVSLAIYINGVSNEIFEMACATPRDGVVDEGMDRDSTRDVYRRLSWLTGNPDLRRRYAEAIRQAATSCRGDPYDAWSRMDTDGLARTRLVVDVVAGTSAGGINGIFLAKALANGQRFDALQDLWIQEGDIALLLNDEKSYDAKAPGFDAARAQKPASLLNSDRMYAKLLGALQSMPPLAGFSGKPTGGGTSPLVDEIDLFVTTTDIQGSAVALRLFDKVVYERRYKQSFHFRYPDGRSQRVGTDFCQENDPFLAFAARCTSSFPFAFEPMTLNALARMTVVKNQAALFGWNAFFPNLSRAEVAGGAHIHRSFGDGGYLDNKPFSYVVETLSRRFAAVPLERKLVFVEPSPEHFDTHRLPDEKQTPDALENSLAAVLSIPRYESIREDLQAVLARNRRIERVERVVRLGELAVNPNDPFSIRLNAEKKVPEWSGLTLSQMVDYYGSAFIPYQRLRISSATDRLADRLGRRRGIDADSDEQYALRALVRVWRESVFDDEGSPGHETVNAFLDQFDTDYRLRRLAFLLRKVDQLMRLFQRQANERLATRAGQDAEPWLPDSEEQAQLRDALPPPFTGLPRDLSPALYDEARTVLRGLKAGLLHARGRLLAASTDTPRGGSDAPGAPPDPFDADLRAVLLVVLGQEGDAQGGIEIAAPGGDRVRVKLPERATRAASASRTLQENVLIRAQALFKEAGDFATTPLHASLIDDIESMRVKNMPGSTRPETELQVASSLGWRVLGGPRLVFDDTQDRVVIRLTQHSLAGFGVLLDRFQQAFDSAAGKALRLFLAGYYLRFDTYDQIGYPLYYDTGTGEPSTVEVVRISPEDATALIDERAPGEQRRKLAGTALANFGAFLDRRWRANDVMWGRLDGAERLIQALLPMSDPDTAVVRKELIERAHRRILRESLVPEGHSVLSELVLRALDETAGKGDVETRLQQIFSQLWSGNGEARDRLGSTMVSLLSEPGLLRYVKQFRQVDPDPDPEATLDSAARAVTIVGRVLEGIADRRDAGRVVPRWIARLGLLLQGIVAVSVPGTLKDHLWRHWVQLLYAFEVLLLAASIVLGSADMRTLAITTFVATAGVHLLTWILKDLMRESRRALRVTVALVVIALLALAAVGARALALRQTLTAISTFIFPPG